MDLQLSEEQVGKAVTDAIVNSVIGEKLKQKVEEEVSKALGASYLQGSIVGDIVKDQVRLAIVLEVEKRKNEIKAIVAEFLTDEKLGEVVSKLWKAWESRY